MYKINRREKRYFINKNKKTIFFFLWEFFDKFVQSIFINFSLQEQRIYILVERERRGDETKNSGSLSHWFIDISFTVEIFFVRRQRNFSGHYFPGRGNILPLSGGKLQRRWFRGSHCNGIIGRAQKTFRWKISPTRDAAQFRLSSSVDTKNGANILQALSLLVEILKFLVEEGTSSYIIRRRYTRRRTCIHKLCGHP